MLLHALHMLFDCAKHGESRWSCTHCVINSPRFVHQFSILSDSSWFGKYIFHKGRERERERAKSWTWAEHGQVDLSIVSALKERTKKRSCQNSIQYDKCITLFTISYGPTTPISVCITPPLPSKGNGSKWKNMKRGRNALQAIHKYIGTCITCRL